MNVSILKEIDQISWNFQLSDNRISIVVHSQEDPAILFRAINML